jgi:hypothetical protein
MMNEQTHTVEEVMPRPETDDRALISNEFDLEVVSLPRGEFKIVWVDREDGSHGASVGESHGIDDVKGQKNLQKAEKELAKALTTRPLDEDLVLEKAEQLEYLLTEVCCAPHFSRFQSETYVFTDRAAVDQAISDTMTTLRNHTQLIAARAILAPEPAPTAVAEACSPPPQQEVVAEDVHEDSPDPQAALEERTGVVFGDASRPLDTGDLERVLEHVCALEDRLLSVMGESAAKQAVLEERVRGMESDLKEALLQLRRLDKEG